MWLLAKIESPWLLLVGLALLTFILLRRSYRYYRRKKKEDKKNVVAEIQRRGEKSEPRRDLPLIDAPVELTRWHVEMHEVARDINAELNSKMISMQALIRLADEATQRMKLVAARLEESNAQQSTEAIQSIQRLAEELSRRTQAVSSSLPQVDLPPIPSWGGKEPPTKDIDSPP